MKIAWIGTGVMGQSMCGHLLKAGHEIKVYNRTVSKTETLVNNGALLAKTPADAAENCDMVFTIVGFPKDVEEVYFGNQGILKTLRKGAIAVDMTTSKPSMAERISEACKKSGSQALDAPVSGGDVGAKEARLAIMCGGEESTFNAVEPLFDLMGKATLMGMAGCGQHTKMCNQTAIASNMVGVVEALIYGKKAGLDLNQLLDVIGTGAASSFSLNNLGRRIAAGNFEPGFFIKHFVKDMGIALEEARRMNLSLPGLAQAQQFHIAAMAEGLENKGTQALYKVFERLNHLED